MLWRFYFWNRFWKWCEIDCKLRKVQIDINVQFALLQHIFMSLETTGCIYDWNSIDIDAFRQLANHKQYSLFSIYIIPLPDSYSFLIRSQQEGTQHTHLTKDRPNTCITNHLPSSYISFTRTVHCHINFRWLWSRNYLRSPPQWEHWTLYLRVRDC